jgi:methionyl-tRNA formyltransferase
LQEQKARHNPRIIYLGTPEFAVPSLDALIRNGYQVSAVVTAPDQPSGRGLHLNASPVKTFALQHNIPVLQPEKLRDETFLKQLENFHADLFIVVAFRMLPEIIWKMPPLGTFNLHASLLPQYRGAAPIQHAVMNGETETGLTTFFLRQEIDTGEIIYQEKIAISPDETSGELHDRMKIAGAGLVIKTVKAIEAGDFKTVDQGALIESALALKAAPKIFREDCRINWSQETSRIYNMIRGLSPVPGAFTFLTSPGGEEHHLKIYRARKSDLPVNLLPGTLQTDGKKYIAVAASDGMLYLEEVQLAGKRMMKTEELLRGFHLNSDWKLR